MKGFMRVFEAIIASIIVLASLSFFFGYQVRQSGWLTAELKVEGQDALNVLQKQGLFDNYMKDYSTADAKLTDIKTTLTKMLSQRIDYSLEIEGAPPPVTKIACGGCTDSEVNEIKSRFSDDIATGEFNFRQRHMRFAIDKKDIADVDDKYNVLITLKHTFSGIEKNQIKTLLMNGTSVIIFSGIDDFSTMAASDRTFLQDVFGLKGRAGLEPSSTLYNADDPERPQAKIFYYFSGLSGITNTDYTFTKLSAGNVDKDDNSTTISAGNAGSNFHLYENGRTAWVNYFSPGSDDDTKNANLFLQSLIMWAADDKFEIVPGPQLTRTLPKTFFRTPYVIASVKNGDAIGFDFYKVNLLVWYIFY